MITCVDLFCGAGGLTHGLARGGVSVVAGIDIDIECHFPYEKNNNARFIHEDVHTINGRELRAYWPSDSLTLLAGCAPCQPFSTYSRSHKAVQDDKWALVSEFGRLVRQSKPDLVTMENVPQLLQHPVFDKFLETLKGYHIWKGVVECSAFGVPQTRKRLVLLASRFGPIEFSQLSTTHELPTVRQAIGHLPRLEAGQSDPNDSLHTACRLSKLNLRRIKASKPGGSWRDWDESLIAECHRKQSGGTYPSVYGRMEWDQPSPTITTQCFGYGNGRFGHPEQNRAITMREAAILQTFPSDYEFVPDGERPRFYTMGRLIGNAVPVRLGEVIAEVLVEHASSCAGQSLRNEKQRRLSV